jgi:aquaporin Z
MAGIPVTNLSLNPARSTGTAVFADGWALQQLWLFWVAPILGGAIAGVVYPLMAGHPPSSAKR